ASRSSVQSRVQLSEEGTDFGRGPPCDEDRGNMLIDEPTEPAYVDVPALGLSEREQDLVYRLHVVVTSHEETGDPRDLDEGFVLARELLSGLMRSDVQEPAGIDELRRLVEDLPALSGLLDRAADTAGDAVERSCADMFVALEVT